MSREKQIKWVLAIPPEVYCEKANTRLLDYYFDPAVRLETHQRAREYFLQTFGHDIGTHVGNGLTSYWNATLFGAELEFSGDSQGAVHRRVLASIEEVRSLKAPTPDRIPDLPRYRELLGQHQRMEKLVPGTGFKASFGRFGFQGPFTTATILRGTDIMTDLVMSPDLVKELLEKIVEAQCNVMTFTEREFGIEVRSCGMGDDYAGLISPDMYEAFCFPYMKQIYDRYGEQARSLHCETLKRGHHQYLNRLKLTSYDPGVNPDITIEDILKECPGLFFTINLHTVRDMVNKLPDGIRAMCEDYVRRGAPGVMAEITVRTPEENIRAFLEAGKTYRENRECPKADGPALPKD
jgi:uroporphyrinogen-III decarboxylase